MTPSSHSIRPILLLKEEDVAKSAQRGEVALSDVQAISDATALKSETLPEFSILKAFLGVVLLIAWIILIRATLGSLGYLGILLAAVFFGLAIWLVIDVLGLSTDNFRVISYIIEIMLASVLSIGVSWSHVRRRISGQVDTDELDREG